MLLSTMPLTAMAQALADRVVLLRCEITAQFRREGSVPISEKERYLELSCIAHSLHLCLENGLAPSDLLWVTDLARLVRRASKPYRKSPSSPRARRPGARPPGRPRKQP